MVNPTNIHFILARSKTLLALNIQLNSNNVIFEELPQLASHPQETGYRITWQCSFKRSRRYESVSIQTALEREFKSFVNVTLLKVMPPKEEITSLTLCFIVSQMPISQNGAPTKIGYRFTKFAQMKDAIKESYSPFFILCEHDTLHQIKDIKPMGNLFTGQTESATFTYERTYWVAMFEKLLKDEIILEALAIYKPKDLECIELGPIGGTFKVTWQSDLLDTETLSPLVIKRLLSPYYKQVDVSSLGIELVLVEKTKVNVTLYLWIK